MNSPDGISAKLSSTARSPTATGPPEDYQEQTDSRLGQVRLSVPFGTDVDLTRQANIGARLQAGKGCLIDEA